MSRILLLVLFMVICAASGFAQNIKNLTIYDAGIAEITEERLINLQTGINQIEWRSLQPKADLRTIRVLLENAKVIRQDVTFDGADVKNEKSPVLHLTVENTGVAGARKILVDYLAPNINWQNNYSLILDTSTNGARPATATLDSWFSVFNNTGVDLIAGTIDLIAGEISFLKQNQNYNEDSSSQANFAITGRSLETVTLDDAQNSTNQVSAFSRFRLGSNLVLDASKTISRFPLFQGGQLPVVQRNSFENAHNIETFGRNNFILLPRGLEVRIVGKNPTRVSMPGGAVTIYARTVDGLQQIVGQDRIQLIPPEGDFAVSQGRSSTLFGTRRIVERRRVNFKDEDGDSEDKLVTTIEVVLTNRSPQFVEAFVREGIEQYDDNRWQITGGSLPVEQWEKLGTNSVQVKVSVPANGKIVVTYTVENR